MESLIINQSLASSVAQVPNVAHAWKSPISGRPGTSAKKSLDSERPFSRLCG